MKEPWSSRWCRAVVLATASLLGLMVFVVMVAEVGGDHVVGTEAQIAWRAHLVRVADALARNDLAGAEMFWREAYAAALKSRHWEGMVAVGDAYRLVGERGRYRKTSEAKARQTYRTALFRARTEGSLEGVLRVAERFAELGDREVVEQCIGVARTVAVKAKDPRDEERVRAFTERWAARALEVDPLGFTQ